MTELISRSITEVIHICGGNDSKSMTELISRSITEMIQICDGHESKSITNIQIYNGSDTDL